MEEFQRFKYDKPEHIVRTSASTIPTMKSMRGASYDEWMKDRAAKRETNRSLNFPEERVANYPSNRIFRTTA